MSIFNERNRTVDILRFIAIVSIIIAHASPNELLFRIRNFDVVLMVLLMGVSFNISQKEHSVNYNSYILKRFKRLIISTWIFLTAFFALFYMISNFSNKNLFFDIKTIVLSFAFNGGIGYVWVMYVFFVVSLFSPLILQLSEKIKSNNKYLLLLIFLYMIYHYLVSLNRLLPVNLGGNLQNYILTPFGYCLIAAVGIRFNKMNKKEISVISGVFLSIFLIFMLLYKFKSTQDFKYPPTIYYISYGLFVSFALYLIFNQQWVQNLIFNRFVFFYSKVSLNLYFLHIISIYTLNFYGQNIPLISEYFIARFLFIICSAMLMTYLYECLIANWLKKRALKKNHKMY
ncbi:acyltransferase [Paenibacillus sp. FSL M7-0802]|uniref:acyltransferase family protein n=1 Tax=Paenibacillus TaxID=44249 RepID=UPI002221FBF0|nr:acyltransferase [Paenibacillus polymyxa]